MLISPLTLPVTTPGLARLPRKLLFEAQARPHRAPCSLGMSHLFPSSSIADWSNHLHASRTLRIPIRLLHPQLPGVSSILSCVPVLVHSMFYVLTLLAAATAHPRAPQDPGQPVILPSFLSLPVIFSAAISTSSPKPLTNLLLLHYLTSSYFTIIIRLTCLLSFRLQPSPQVTSFQANCH